MPSAEPRLLYADSSALVKLVIEEPESSALTAHIGTDTLATSRIAVLEVSRATAIANPDPEVRAATERLLDSCLLVDVDERLLRDAAELASAAVRTLDAVHLASARRVDPDEVLVYDRRLSDAARDAGLTVSVPGRDG